MDKHSELQKIEGIILKSEYKILAYSGLSDGTSLGARFDISLFQNRNMLLKSIQFIPYYTADAEDVRYSDGTIETILASMRVNRVFDWYGNPAVDNYRTYIAINDRPIISINNANQQGSLPVDFKVDNIYYLVPNPVKSITIQNEAELVTNISTGVRQTANLKCFLEVYLFND